MVLTLHIRAVWHYRASRTDVYLEVRKLPMSSYAHN